MLAALDALLVVSLAAPVALSFAWAVTPLRRAAVAVAPWAALPALALALLCLARPDLTPAVAAPEVLTGLRLHVDGLGATFLLLTALLWVAAGAFAWRYHADDPGRERFFAFFALTLAGNLGVVLAADLLSFYVSFAVMTLSAYGLVVHRRDEGAMRAGRVYIILALLGEVALLTGLFALGAASAGGLGFGPELTGAWATLLEGGAALGVASVMVAGFAVKAGLVPLHVWLPLAHPAAPTAASALLSGAMIKAGLLGWLRVAPPEVALPSLGLALVVVGLFTAFYGVVVGLAQDDPKAVLAYSSVSQMGTMALGLGVALAAPGLAPLALAAVLAYALHHGVAKAALFLSVGVADRLPARAGSSSGPCPRWRGLLRAGVAVSALALAGAPFTSGALAKGLLKGPAAAFAGAHAGLLEALLLVAAAGTTLLLARFAVTLEARVTAREWPTSAAAPPARPRGPWGLALPWAALVLAGLTAPGWLAYALPAADGVPLPELGAGVASSLLPVLAGLALAWAVARRPGLLGRAARLRVPPGDLLAPMAAAARRLRLPERHPFARLPRLRGGTTERLTRPITSWLRSERRWELALLRGPVLGLLLLLIIASVALALAL